MQTIVPSIQLYYTFKESFHLKLISNIISHTNSILQIYREPAQMANLIDDESISEKHNSK